MRLITLDFETYYDKDYSLSKLTTEQYVRDPRFEVILVGVKVDNDPPQWFSGTHQEIRAWLEQFDIPNSALLGHHTAFDGFILQHHFGIVPKFYFCTMSMAKPKHGQDIGVSLAALAEKYTVGIKGDAVVSYQGKRRADFSTFDLQKYADYCCNDVQLTYMLLQILKRDFPLSELKVIDLFVRMFADPVLELDAPFLEKHLVQVRERREQLVQKLSDICGKADVMSNAKFAEVLRRLGVEPPKKVSPRTGELTFAFAKNDTAFKELLEHPNELVRIAVEARLGLKTTIEETRTEALLGIASRGAWPIYLNYYGANGTGRASGGDGVNPQNMHRGGALRRAVKAPEGHTLVVADSSQIEARGVAWLSGQEDLIEDFRNKADIYSKFATEIYGRPIDRKLKIKQANGVDFYPDSAEGFVGKTCILGLGYGMGGEKLRGTLKVGAGGEPVDLELGKCHEIVQHYRNKYRRIPRLWDQGEGALWAITRGEERRLDARGLLRTSAQGIHLPNGMIIRYPGLTFVQGEGFLYARNRRQQAEWVKQSLSGKWDPRLLTRIYGGKVIENAVQALARIVVFDQMLEIAKYFRVVLTVHDEVVACVPTEQASEAATLIAEAMSRPPAWAPSWPVACDVHVGGTYGEAK